MTIGTMLRDVLTSLVRRPVTEKYPFERQPVPDRLRGMVVFDPEGCIGCDLCTRDCPSDAIELSVLDRKAKRFVMHYQIDRCLFCAQCVSSCPRTGLSMSNERWELAALCREPFDIYYGRDEDVKDVRDGGAPADHDAC
jgi:formate hydrogenlyase subunit 6/NADH:ubiquinone oxidoreductase subunit I